jgi:clan AA aspartic protease (TIGR02281 family)
MMMTRLLGVALIGLALASPVMAQERCAAQPVASLPIVILFGKVLVPVQVNDQPALFAIDTGGYASAVSETLVTRLGLKTGPIRSQVKLTDIGGEKADKFAIVAGLAIGNQLVKGERYMVAELGPGVDGFIAPDLLQNFDLDFNFAANQLDLYRRRACGGKPPGTAAFSTVAMDTSKGGHIRIPVTLNGKRVTALLDTGASETYITADYASASFGIGMVAEQGVTRGAVGGTLAFSQQEFQSLQIGDAVEHKPQLRVADRRNFDWAPILLGMRHMQQHRLFVSYGEDKLYIAPGQPTAR